MDAPQRVDLIVEGTVVTTDAARRVVADGAVAIDGGTIVAVGVRRRVTGAYDATARIGGAHAVVTPGLIDVHQHLTGDRLLHSSIPDDLPPGEALTAWALPAHAAHDGDDDELSATLALAEALTNGVTTVVEAGTVAHPDRVAAAFTATGARGTLGTWGWDIGDGAHTASADEVLARQQATVEALAGVDRVDGWVTLVGHDLMSDELAAGAATLARRLGTRLTFHCSPSPADPAAYLTRTWRRPLVHLDEIGVLGPHAQVAHAVHIDDDEIAALVATDTAVASCPWAYLRLGQGVTGAGRHVELIARGVRLGLGGDSENAGDAIDMLRAAALFAGLAKDTAADPTVSGAHDAFALATIGGAAAIGRDHDLGSIEVGKRADLVVHDTRTPQWIPRSDDVVLQLVWATDGRTVSDVVVDGRPVVRDRRLVGLDLVAVADEARLRRAALLERAGLAGL